MNNRKEIQPSLTRAPKLQRRSTAGEEGRKVSQLILRFIAVKGC
jgi:hypothetical protein